MLDQSTAYAYADDDTEVVDVPEPPIPIRGRVPTAELTLQVRVMGQWHRRTPDLATTACGVPYHSEFADPRREQLTMADGGLCVECFHPFELNKAIENDRAAEEFARDEQRKRDAASARRETRRWKLPTEGER